MASRDTTMDLDLERALRWAATCHEGQYRRGSGVPYVAHAMAVGLILDRLGYGPEVVIAGLLHDVVEDTEATEEDVRARFGPVVADLVAVCSEVKLDAQGRKRPWIDRKRDHLEVLSQAPPDARAIALADKLHNLRSIQLDLAEGRPIWSAFHADRQQVLDYYRQMIERLGVGDPRLERLAQECRAILDRL